MVCSYDFTGDRKPKTEMAFGIPGFFSPVKALKNMFFVSIGNARTVIGHREKILMISDRKSKVDMSACRSIADGILNENREYLPDAHFIAGIRRKRFFREGTDMVIDFLAASGSKASKVSSSRVSSSAVLLESTSCPLSEADRVSRSLTRLFIRAACFSIVARKPATSSGEA